MVEANASSPSKLLDAVDEGDLWAAESALLLSRSKSAVAAKSAASELRHSCAICMLVFMIESMNMLENMELELVESRSASLLLPLPSSSSSSYFHLVRKKIKTSSYTFSF